MAEPDPPSASASTARRRAPARRTAAASGPPASPPPSRRRRRARSSCPSRPRPPGAKSSKALHGVVVIGHDHDQPPQSSPTPRRWSPGATTTTSPFLGIDHGLHVLNTAHGGTLLQRPAARPARVLQHRHPPERGLRHAINVLPDTVLADLYGEGEVVVNSEHRKAVSRVARGLRRLRRRLDGVVEASSRTANGGRWACSGTRRRRPRRAWTSSCSAAWSRPASSACSWPPRTNTSPPKSFGVRRLDAAFGLSSLSPLV